MICAFLTRKTRLTKYVQEVSSSKIEKKGLDMVTLFMNILNKLVNIKLLNIAVNAQYIAAVVWILMPRSM